MTEAQINAIPSELREFNQWTGWKPVDKNGKTTKPPCNPITGRLVDVMQKENLFTFDTALEALRKHPGKAEGIGFAFNEHGISGIDIDHCIDTAGNLSPEARAIVDKVNSYTEFSPSGTGLHILVKGTLPEKYRKPPTETQTKRGERKGFLGSKKGAFEAYSSGRYFTMTGNVFEERGTIEARQDELEWFYTTFIKSDPIPEPTKATPPKSDSLYPSSADELLAAIGQSKPQGKTTPTVQEIMALASNARNGEKFKSLMSGNLSGSDDDNSKADSALCSILAFWCGKDPVLMEAVFNESELGKRDKWLERADYRKRTIEFG